MKKKYFIAMAIAALISAAGCSTGGAQSDEPESEVSQGHKLSEENMNTVDQYTVIKFESKILDGTLTGENTEQLLCVYLPPSYHQTEKSYPVVYYLHGFGESGTAFVTGQRAALDEAFSAGAKEFILVSIEGTTRAGGSFFVNSPVSGNWEDYILNEVIPTIDLNFRTLAQRDSRGICGFSMGGFGAINLSLRNPDVFSSFLSFSPGLIADGDLPVALESWASDSQFQKAYAQAFSPNKKDEENYGNIPQADGTLKDEKIEKEWENGYGTIDQKIEDYIKLDKPLKAMKVVYGELDTYSWIPRGCEFLSECLTEHGIEHSVESIRTSHSMPYDVTETYLVPFFNENLVYDNE